MLQAAQVGAVCLGAGSSFDEESHLQPLCARACEKNSRINNGSTNVTAGIDKNNRQRNANRGTYVRGNRACCAITVFHVPLDA